MTKAIFVPLTIAITMSTSTSMGRSQGTVEFLVQRGSQGGDATAEEVEALTRASQIANSVKNSDCFHEFLSSRNLIETNGHTPLQVAAHLQGLSGKLPVSFYFRCLGGSHDCNSPTFAVAYRQPPDPTVYINRAYYDVRRADFDVYELAGSLAHEGIGHSLAGYEHSYNWTPDRDFSVPYSVSGASRENDDAFQHCRHALGY